MKTQKEALRRQARERRSEIRRAQGDIGEALASIFFDDLSLNDLSGDLSGKTGCVAGYWPVRDEPDPRPLMARLAALGWQCALPAVDASNAPLVFRGWQPGDDLSPGAYDIPEPLADQPTLSPDMVLVPLLAFDRTGHRLGYGAGHYDRTLAQLRRDGQSTAQRGICVVGLAYAGCECDALPVGVHDEAMDMIVTERGVVRPERAAA